MVYSGEYKIFSPPSPQSVDSVISILEDWFWAIERGEAGLRLIDPFGARYSKEQVDKVIGAIDSYIDMEASNYTYWRDVGMRTKGKEIDMPSDFNRLTGESREAFVQALKEGVKV